MFIPNIGNNHNHQRYFVHSLTIENLHFECSANATLV